MDFTPANDGNNSGLDDLKKNVIDANLKQPESQQEPTPSQESVSSWLDALNDVVANDNHTFSMDDASLMQWNDPMTEISDDVVPSSDTPLPRNNTSSARIDNDDDLAKITIEVPQVEHKENASSIFSFDDDEKQEQSRKEKLGAMLHTHINTHSLTWYILSILIFFWAVLGSLYFYYAERYVYYSTRPADSLDETAQSVLMRINSYRNILQTIGLGSSSILENVPTWILPQDDQQMLHNTLSDDSIWYVETYNYFHAYLNLLNRRLPQLYSSVLDAREELASYPFFPDLLQQIIDPNNDSSLQRSLLSLEWVKFRTAIAVFSKFDTFIRQFSLITWRSKEDVSMFLDTIMNRGDVDIDYYLTTCYLNPYENPDVCDQYGDFRRTYDFYEGDNETIDTTFFAQMMWFIDDKLENSVLPSLSLSTRDFDPINQKLTLVIDVNTLPDDTLQLLQQGILNPHIYVVGNMINFLRQSKFIVSEDININELKINKILVPVWSKDITVSTSHFEFSLPLQKNTQREITDYFISRQPQTIDYVNDGWVSYDLSGDVVVNEDPLSITWTVSDPLLFSGFDMSTWSLETSTGGSIIPSTSGGVMTGNDRW